MSRRGSECGYERSDVPPRLLVVLGGGLALTVAGLLLTLRFAYPSVATPETRGPLQPLPDQPRLESAPTAHLIAYRRSEAKKLEPIDRAMRQVAATGWRSGK